MANWGTDLGLVRMADVGGLTQRLRETGTVETGKGVEARFDGESYAVRLKGRETARLDDPQSAVEVGLLTWLMSRHGTRGGVETQIDVLRLLGFSDACEAYRRGGPRVFEP